MSNPRKDIEALIAALPRSLDACAEIAPHLYRCPNGHRLPNRKPWGRCSPAGCCDDGDVVRRYPGGATRGTREVGPADREIDLVPLRFEQEAVEKVPEGPQQALAVSEQAAESLQWLRATARKAARDALVPPPPLPASPPPRPGAQGARQWVEQRLAELAPHAVRELEMGLLFGGLTQRQEAAKEVLDRAGHSKNRPPSQIFNGPVLIVNQGATPWDKQREIEVQAERVK